MFRRIKLGLSLGLITFASPMFSWGQQTDSLRVQVPNDTIYIVNQLDLEKSLQRLSEELRMQSKGTSTSSVDAQSLELLKLHFMLSRLQQPQSLRPDYPAVAPAPVDTALNNRLSRLEEMIQQFASKPTAVKSDRTANKKVSSKKSSVAQPIQTLNPTEATKDDLRTININTSQPLQQRLRPDTIVVQTPVSPAPSVDTVFYNKLVERLSRLEQTSDNKAELDQLRQQLTSLKSELDRPVITKTVVEEKTPVALDFERQIFFAVGKSTLTNTARIALDELVGALKALQTSKVHLTGFASPEGSAELNARLAQNRLDAVVQYLLSRGITTERIQTQVGGIDESAEPRSLARRVQALLYN